MSQYFHSLTQWLFVHLSGPLLAGYVASLVFIFLYSFSQAHLILHYIRSRRKVRPLPQARLTDALPFVTVQLPVYNEKYVVARLLEAVGRLRYPAGRLDIQVLDDSTDETSEIIAQKVEELSHLSIRHLRREDRKGYKAGALQDGLCRANGELIAIFDADFVPDEDFLLATVPQFANPKVGMVQTRWGHVNEAENLLTRLQAFGLDTHFTVEQTGRYAGGFFLNFNGTAGVWRKSCIEEAGGWQADTLTEDLDLSYRAQLKGWQFAYLEGVVSPAELPSLLRAYRLQQYRWTKGAAQNTRKHLLGVLGARLPWRQKWHATAHLLNSGLFVFVFLSSLLSVPALWIKNRVPAYAPYFQAASVFILSFIVFALCYFVPVLYKAGTRKGAFLAFVRTYPGFLSLSMGLSLHNALAVLEGYGNRRTPFVRTPKFNTTPITPRMERATRRTFSWLGLLEGALVLYFAGGVWSAFYLSDFTLLFFHAMLAIGFSLVFYYTWSEPIRLPY
ncbi:MAG: glycosyltransferase [Cytophagales bacterium]|nr:glycosyltransferase [Cytophagales bacterium]